MRVFRLLVGLVALTLVLGACSGGGDGDGGGGDNGGGTGPQVVGTEFSFNPATITVSTGQAVTLTFKNEGGIGHSFVISDLGVNSGVIDEATSTTVTFTPSQAGTFQFICDVPGHLEAGMEGTITVQ